MDFRMRLYDFLERMNLYAPISFDELRQGNAITIRHAPSVGPHRFLDKSREDTFTFQLLTQHTNQLEALSTLENMMEVLEQTEDIPSGNSSYQFISCSIYTSANLVQVNDRGEYLYTGLMETKLNRK